MQQQQQQQNTVVVTQPAAPSTTVVATLSDQPMPYTCNVCNTQSVTRVDYKVGTMTVLLVILLCFLLWPLGLCPLALIPCCINGTKDAHHSCPNCNNYVGAKKRM